VGLNQAHDKEVHKNVVVRNTVSHVVLNALHYDKMVEQVAHHRPHYDHVAHDSGDQARDKEDHNRLAATAGRTSQCQIRPTLRTRRVRSTEGRYLVSNNARGATAKETPEGRYLVSKNARGPTAKTTPPILYC
jgi:hypothetical protein